MDLNVSSQADHPSQDYRASKHTSIIILLHVSGFSAWYLLPWHSCEGGGGGGRAHYVMVSTIQWKPFWLATQLYSQNEWAGQQNGVNDDVCAKAPLGLGTHSMNIMDFFFFYLTHIELEAKKIERQAVLRHKLKSNQEAIMTPRWENMCTVCCIFTFTYVIYIT